MPRTFELPTTNNTTAEFIGIQHVPSRSTTSQCPNIPDHGHDAAWFKICNCEKNPKPGKYGDAQKDIFQVKLSEDPEGSKHDRQHTEIVAKIATLMPGQRVKLYWEQISVNDETDSKYSERTIRSLECI
jgi:hypothetical protein